MSLLRLREAHRPRARTDADGASLFSCASLTPNAVAADAPIALTGAPVNPRRTASPGTVRISRSRLLWCRRRLLPRNFDKPGGACGSLFRASRRRCAHVLPHSVGGCVSESGETCGQTSSNNCLCTFPQSVTALRLECWEHPLTNGAPSLQKQAPPKLSSRKASLGIALNGG